MTLWRTPPPNADWRFSIRSVIEDVIAKIGINAICDNFAAYGVRNVDDLPEDYYE